MGVQAYIVAGSFLFRIISYSTACSVFYLLGCYWVFRMVCGVCSGAVGFGCF